MALLALRNSGEAPQLIADQLVATADLTDLYLLDTRERIDTLTEPAPAVGFNVYSTGDFTVPAAELWYVWAYALIAAPGGAEAIRLCPCVLIDGTPMATPTGDMESAAANEQVRPWSRSKFWLGPGSQLGFIVQSVTGAPAVNASAIITRLRV